MHVASLNESHEASVYLSMLDTTWVHLSHCGIDFTVRNEMTVSSRYQKRKIKKLQISKTCVTYVDTFHTEM